jgi:hypothetical protein
LAPATVGAFYLRKTSGSLAIFAAIRRASSRVKNSSAADRRTQWPFLGFRVKMQPPTTIAIMAAKKIPSCTCCIVVFSVA